MNFEILILFSFVVGIISSDNFPFYYIFSILPLFLLPKINKKSVITFLLFFLLGYYITENYKKDLLPENIELSQNCLIEGEIINIKVKKMEKEI
ncbi:MAG: hypothetical protein ACP5H7_03280, partial [Minisyncoccia bacterium]